MALQRRNTAGGTNIVIATLDGAATAYVDPVPAGGIFSYELMNEYAEAGILSVASGPSPGRLSVTGTLLDRAMDTLQGAALAPDGTWGLEETSVVESLKADGWPASPSLGSALVDLPQGIGLQGWIAQDSGGLPHFFAMWDDGSVLSYNHCYFRAGQWSSELLVTADKLPGSLMKILPALAPSGDLVCLFMTQNVTPVGTFSLILVHKVNGTYRADTLATPACLTGNGPISLTLDAHGLPHILSGSGNVIEEDTQDASGTWTATVLPAGTSTNIGLGCSVCGAWTDSGNGLVVFDSDTGSVRTVYALARTGGAWGNPVPVSTNGFANYASMTQVARSADGSRFAILTPFGSFGMQVFTPTDSGWAASPLGAAGEHIFLGFDATNRLHVLSMRYDSCLTEYTD